MNRYSRFFVIPMLVINFSQALGQNGSEPKAEGKGEHATASADLTGRPTDGAVTEAQAKQLHAKLKPYFTDASKAFFSQPLLIRQKFHGFQCTNADDGKTAFAGLLFGAPLVPGNTYGAQTLVFTRYPKLPLGSLANRSNEIMRRYPTAMGSFPDFNTVNYQRKLQELDAAIGFGREMAKQGLFEKSEAARRDFLKKGAGKRFYDQLALAPRLNDQYLFPRHELKMRLIRMTPVELEELEETAGVLRSAIDQLRTAYEEGSKAMHYEEAEYAELFGKTPSLQNLGPSVVKLAQQPIKFREPMVYAAVDEKGRVIQEIKYFSTTSDSGNVINKYRFTLKEAKRKPDGSLILNDGKPEYETFWCSN